MISKISKTAPILVLISLLGDSCWAGSPILSTELSAEDRLLLARNQAAQNQNISLDDYISYDENVDGEFDGTTGECGNINIGNVQDTPRIGAPPQTVNVIVTGPVFNTVDDC